MRYLLTIALLLTTVSTQAQRYRVDSFNIYPGAGPSHPNNFNTLNNKLIFVAYSTLNYYSLFETDGNSMPKPVNNPNKVKSGAGGIVLNSKLYFPGETSATGREIYVYDGTNPPTLEIDVVSGANDSEPSDLIAFNNKLYFTTLINSKIELAVYDPTTSKVNFITNKFAGTFTGSTSIRNFIQVGNQLFFSGNTAATGQELFVYETMTDTILLFADIYPGSTGSNPGQFIVYKNILYFSASNDTHGCELWKCDGINPPVRLTDLSPGMGDGLRKYTLSHPVYDMGVYNDKLFFRGTTTSSTSAHNLCVYDINADTAGIFQYFITNPGVFFNYADKLFFSGRFQNSYTMFQYDGKDTAEVVEFANGYKFKGAASNYGLYNNAVFLNINSSSIGEELYKFTDSSVSIQHIPAISSTTLYPNPVTQDAHIDIKLNKAETIAINLTDINGRLIYNQHAKVYSTGEHSITVPMQELPTGMYMYRLLNNQNILLHSGKLQKR